MKGWRQKLLGLSDTRNALLLEILLSAVLLNTLRLSLTCIRPLCDIRYMCYLECSVAQWPISEVAAATGR